MSDKEPFKYCFMYGYPKMFKNYDLEIAEHLIEVANNRSAMQNLTEGVNRMFAHSLLAQANMEQKEWQGYNGISHNSFDAVTRPSHYTEGRSIEPIDAIEDWKLSYHLGNAVKYISRAGRKSKDKEREDIKKAIWYLNRHLEGMPE